MIDTELNPEAVGLVSAPWGCEWGPREAQLYALAVGACADDPTGPELCFTTENSHGIELGVLPTFASVAARPRLWQVPGIGPVDMRRVLHAQERIVLHGPLPPVGNARGETRVVKLLDKGRDAVVELRADITDRATGRQLFSIISQSYISDGGGWGGTRVDPDEPSSVPHRAPDQEITFRTSPAQALLFRLCGDRNPLHSDPWFAARAGFGQPILHGLCTFGFTGRALLSVACGSDPSRLREMRARFVAPVTPGTELTVQVWDEPEHTGFRTLDGEGNVVLDRGQALIRRQ